MTTLTCTYLRVQYFITESRSLLKGREGRGGCSVPCMLQNSVKTDSVEPLTHPSVPKTINHPCLVPSDDYNSLGLNLLDTIDKIKKQKDNFKNKQRKEDYKETLQRLRGTTLYKFWMWICIMETTTHLRSSNRYTYFYLFLIQDFPIQYSLPRHTDSHAHWVLFKW